MNLSKIKIIAKRMYGFDCQNESNYHTYLRFLLEQMKRHERVEYEKIFNLSFYFKDRDLKGAEEYALKEGLLIKDGIGIINTFSYEVAKKHKIVHSVEKGTHYVSLDTDIYYLVSQGMTKSEIAKDQREDSKKVIFISKIPDNLIEKFIEKSKYWIRITQRRLQKEKKSLEKELLAIKDRTEFFYFSEDFKLVLPDTIMSDINEFKKHESNL